MKMKKRILMSLVLLAAACAQAETMQKYIKHSSGLLLTLGAGERAVITSSTTAALPHTLSRQTDGAWAVSIADAGTTRYLSLGTADGWSTYYRTAYDSQRSKYSIEDVDGKYIRLRNAATGRYLGTDGTGNNDYVYSNKSGTDARHHWYLVDKASDTLPLDTLTYMVCPAQRLQPCEGWGVSLCWWARMCGEWDDASLDRLITWLVSPQGLNMRIFRYNIGGGDDPLNTHCEPHHMGKGKGLRAEMEGFQDEPGGPYLWERDSAQRRVMLKIREKRPDAIFEAFSNSAPWWMTYSGCCAGAVRASDDNLKPEYYEAFAHYLVDVCKYYRDKFGIEFRTLEPFNEPMTDYWYAGGGQEGCHLDTQSQINFLRVLHPILQQSGLRTVIAASDETDVAHAVQDIRAFTQAGILDLVGQWNTHTYGGNDHDRSRFGSLGRATGKPVWMSEVGSGGNGLAGNLALMQKMFQDIHYIMPTAWIDWQYVEEVGDQWCLVRAQFSDPSSAQRVKSYYVRSTVTRFIREGYTFVPALCPRTLAAVNPAADTLVISLLNTDAVRTVHRIRLPFASVVPPIRCYETSATRDVSRVLGRAVQEGDTILRITLEPQSILTLQIPIRLQSTAPELRKGDKFYIVPQTAHDRALEAEGTTVRLGALDLLSLRQQWTLEEGTDEQTFRLRNGEGRYITARRNTYALQTVDRPVSGTLMRQSFTLEPVADYHYRILSGTEAFDLSDGSLLPGTPVGIKTYGSGADADTRHWLLIRVEDPSTQPDAIRLPVHTTSATMPTAVYNLLGQRLSAPRRGLNIVQRAGKSGKALY